MSRKKEFELHQFTVEGSGEFPIDMLRYDACWPKDPNRDSGGIAMSYIRGHCPKRRVTLFTRNMFAPTEGRWNSFTWRVVPLAELKPEDI